MASVTPGLVWAVKSGDQCSSFVATVGSLSRLRDEGAKRSRSVHAFSLFGLTL